MAKNNKKLIPKHQTAWQPLRRVPGTHLVESPEVLLEKAEAFDQQLNYLESLGLPRILLNYPSPGERGHTISPAKKKHWSTKVADGIEHFIFNPTIEINGRLAPNVLGGITKTLGGAALGAAALTNLPTVIGYGLADEALNTAIDYGTNGKYYSWGNLIQDKTGVDERIADWTSPVFYAGSAKAAYDFTKPLVLRYGVTKGAQKAIPTLLIDRQLSKGLEQQATKGVVNLPAIQINQDKPQSPFYQRASAKHLLPEDRTVLPMYTGKTHSVKEILNPDSSVNLKRLEEILNENADLWGGNRMRDRMENPKWHKTDPTTYHHTQNVIRSAWGMPVPEGYTREQFSLASALHDAGKIFTGEGHGPIGADYFKWVFPDMDESVYRAIASHMEGADDALTLAVRAADINNGRNAARITEAERLGIPKSERNNVVSARLYPVGTALLYVQLGAVAVLDNASRYRLPTIEEFPEDYSMNAPYRKTFLNSNRDRINNWKGENDIFGEELPKEFLDYLEQIKEYPINLMFANNQTGSVIIGSPLLGERAKNVSDLPSFYVRSYRDKLARLGYDTSNITDDLLLRLISQLYNQLTSSMTGKTKGQVFWHGSNEPRDVFDFSHTGESTGNMGAMGPGNYFSSGASNYGGLNYADWHSKGVHEPFLITGISLTPVGGLAMIDKGLIPSYVSPGGDQTEAYKLMLLNLIRNTPVESSTLWIDPALIGNSGVAPLLTTKGFTPMEFMLRRNTGIKSLFPHPQAVVRNSDGTVSLLRNWDDLRVGFKKGGRIHIKKKNRGKFTASAKKAGEGVQEHAHKVVNDPNASTLQKKRALFAINAKKWKK